MTKEQLIEELMDIMETDEELTETTVLADVDEWDSLAKLSLMAMAKKECKVSLTAAEVKGFITVQDILDALV